MKRGFKFHIVQLGCASNQADSFSIASCLLSYGCFMENDITNSDIIIIMTCGFSLKQHNNSIDCIINISKKKQRDTKIWVGGCIPAINEKIFEKLPVDIDLYFSPRGFENTLNSYLKTQSYHQPIFYQNSTSNSFPIRIANGCTENCSYCVIKKAGGNTLSKPVQKIINEVVNLGENINEIKLVGEEIGAYGKDIGKSLMELVQSIIDVRPAITISFSAIHPKYFIQDFNMYMNIYKYKNIDKILPIPIQSGSNSVLKQMNRNYKIEDVVEHIQLFLEYNSTVKISTDVMVGFPSESWSDFLLTKELIEQLPLFALDCFKYDDMRGLGDTVLEEEKIKRLKIIALTFIRDYCKSNNIDKLDSLETFVNSNKFPLNINF